MCSFKYAAAPRLLKNSRTVSRKSIYGTPAGGWVASFKEQ